MKKYKQQSRPPPGSPCPPRQNAGGPMTARRQGPRKRARRHYQAYPGVEALEAWRHRETVLKKTYRRARADLHWEKVSSCNSQTELWGLNRWMSSDGVPRQAFMSAIKDNQGRLQEDNHGKARALQGVLFPKPPEADLSDIQVPHFPRPLPFEDISLQEVQKAIRSSKADNAPGGTRSPTGSSKWQCPLSASCSPTYSMPVSSYNTGPPPSRRPWWW